MTRERVSSLTFTPLDSKGASIVSLQGRGNWPVFLGAGQYYGQPSVLIMWGLDGNPRKILRDKTLPKMLRYPMLSPDYTLMAATGYEASHVHLWKWPQLTYSYELSLRKPVSKSDSFPDEETVVEGLNFSPDGLWLAAACWDQRVKLWSLKEKRRTDLMPMFHDDVTMAGFADDRTIVGASPRQIRAWNLSKGVVVWEISLRSQDWWQHAISEDGKRIVSVGDKGILRVWDTRTWKYEQYKLPISRRSFHVNISPSNDLIAVALDKRELLLVGMNDGSVVAKANIHAQSTAFIDGGKRLVAAELREDRKPNVIWSDIAAFGLPQK
jgi:hypothetical protein